MNRLLTIAATVAVAVSITHFAVGQQASQNHYRSAALPPAGNFRSREWRPSYSRPDARAPQSVLRNYNDVDSWNDGAAPARAAGSSNPRGYYPASHQTSLNAQTLSREPTYFEQAGGISASFSSSDLWEVESDQNFLVGDIFGVGINECCDEWANHCPCLELTNSRSKCRCTNPYRTKQEPCRDGYRINPADCNGCNRSARRSTVSEYFHPEQYRR